MATEKKQAASTPPDAGELIKPVKFEPYTGEKTASSFLQAFSLNLKTCLIGVLLVSSVFIAWFMFTAKAVHIETDPVNADIDINGGLKLKLGNRYLIRPGEYDFNLSALGYYPVAERLTVSREQAQRYVYQLQKQPGHLQVDTGAVTGAEVFIDNISRGKAPVTIRDVPPGPHLVEIKTARYFPFRENIRIEGLDREQSLMVDLTPAWAEVSFDSEPGGAQVFNGETPLGKTPLTQELLEGKHEIKIKSPGYEVWQDEINVVAGKPLALTNIKLEPAAASLFLVSQPARANTTVNGSYAGLTPLELSLTPGEKTNIRLFKQGYKPAVRTLTAKSGEQKRLRVTLEPELVSVAVNVKPADAQLYIDGALVGTANRTLQLPARKHRIEIRKKDYVDYKTTLIPHIGIDQELNVRLKSIKQAKLQDVKPVITTLAGQVLKLFHPGAFTMGASRREPGRRANETIRNIRLTRPFYLGLKEVTNREYKLFDKGFSSGLIDGNNLNGETQPVVNVTWQQAARYCNWLSNQASLAPFYIEKDNKITGFDKNATGYRLPTEAEWAWAARATSGNAPLKFPWGNQMPPTNKSGNFADRKSAVLLGKIIGKYDDGFIVTAPVGSFAPDKKGLFDMGGNAAEWTNDFYDIAISADKKVKVDPLGPLDGEFHVIRGSSWAHGTITELRLSFRDYGNKSRSDVGFRIARYLD